ncbi:MAG: hypothetical protein CMI53_01455 [Parcubacteria group bacterium]|nr:hypothetical protein [Parcubacteria group bacterium]
MKANKIYRLLDGFFVNKGGTADLLIYFEIESRPLDTIFIVFRGWDFFVPILIVLLNKEKSFMFKEKKEVIEFCSLVEKDIPKLYSLMEPEMRQGRLLPRSIKDIIGITKSIGVLRYNGVIAGTIGLVPYGPWAEIIMWWVNVKYRGRSFSSQLLHAAINEAKTKLFESVFLCTTSVRINDYLLLNGFSKIHKDNVPKEKWQGYPEGRDAQVFITRLL